MKRVLSLIKRGVKWYLRSTIVNGFVVTPTGCVPVKE